MFAIVLLALGLAMDAVAVALVEGAVGRRASLGGALQLGVIFGLAQGLMPLLGWAVGVAFAGLIEAYDHWVAFALLTVIGARMIRSPAAAEVPEQPRHAGARHLALWAAAVATSIDAAAAGLALPALGAPIGLACLTIGAVTAVLCTAACLLGSRIPSGGRKVVEVTGGLILIGLGVAILLDHTQG